MSDRSDELFDDGPPSSRIRWVKLMLWIALPLDLFGVVCCTSVPGAGLTLAAWALADSELARVESGHLPVEVAPELNRLKRFSLVLLVVCGLSFVLQAVLLTNGTYETLIFMADLWVSSL